MHTLTLAHSADPDDAFMWWPLTGKVHPDGAPYPGRAGEPLIRSDRFRFRAVPGDISRFNTLASEPDERGGAPYDITALSVRAWAGVADRYLITNAGSSFGEGYGPKVVCRADAEQITCQLCLRRKDVRIAVPGLRTSAFLTLGLMLGREVVALEGKFLEVPFDQVIPKVRDGSVGAGLVIHEGQVTFAQAGLREVLDLGAWWMRERGLPLPLGINAIKRDLDIRFGAGSVAEVARLLEMSIDHALTHRDESIAYTMPFAALNAEASGTPPPTREVVERYVDMYVTDLTVDMGQRGRTAIEWLLKEGAAAGLCPVVREVDVV
ncbi:MAG: MqnA/MqnD/SBP family protein [Phycisphaerales bacterium]